MARTKYGNVKTQATEKQEQAAIIQLIESIGGKVYKLGGARKRGDFPGTMQTPGLPDLWAFLPVNPRIVMPHQPGMWIEVKAKGGRVRPEQLNFGEWCKLAKVPYVRGTKDDVIDWLTRQGWLR